MGSATAQLDAGQARDIGGAPVERSRGADAIGPVLMATGKPPDVRRGGTAAVRVVTLWATTAVPAGRMHKQATLFSYPG